MSNDKPTQKDFERTKKELAEFVQNMNPENGYIVIAIKRPENEENEKPFPGTGLIWKINAPFIANVFLNVIKQHPNVGNLLFSHMMVEAITSKEKKE